LNQIANLQLSPHLTALRSMFLLAMHHGVHVPPDLLGRADPNDSVNSVLRIMREIGLTAKLLRHRSWRDVSRLGSAYPAMAERLDGSWLIVACIMPTEDGLGALAVLDPVAEAAGVTVVPRADFEAMWTGRLILAKRKQRLADPKQPFGLRWFAPEIMRNAAAFRGIAVAAMMSNVIAFAIPLLFNVMIDKVVPHHSYNTLLAVILVFGVVILFDAIFGYVRQSLMVMASNKIDARLAGRTFAHLLSLPLQFFESHPAGVLLRDMQQGETIRHFLTGRLFQTLLDASALPLLLVGLAIYSGKLTLLVLGFAMTIAGVIALLIPIFRRELERLYQAEGERQADLVETLHGMRAIKSLALEQIRKTSWDHKVASSVRRRATVGRIGAVANVLTTFLEKLMQISIIGFGVAEVFNGNLTIGALIAFNMLSGRVTGPLVQIVSLINEYQQTSLAVKMLGKIMDHAPERYPNQRGGKPPVLGRLEFQDVRFRYEGSVTPALNNVSFAIREGQVIGVVGRSGSGKTTLTRLIQGIQPAQEGLIRLDGYDIRHIDLTHLRRSIGVVLQDNVLFRGSIYDNIAAAQSTASLEEVMEAARLAGADEFIERLPGSYGTMVEEGATNFSGGQRQRIAIARALLTKPRLLLFDEATSALDPESEAIVQQNLADIARGRTMIIVSHRLSSLVGSDAILVLDHGEVADFAPHAVLLQRCEIYRHLWDQQTRHLQ
jgi:ATP-binding cassette subfamily B protein